MKKIDKTNKNKQSEASVRRLINASKYKTDEVLKKYGNTFDGYDEIMGGKMREKYGENVISHQKENSLIKRIFKSFINLFTLILIFLAVMSFIMDVSMASPGKQDYTAVVIVLTMVAISGILRFVQETRSNNSAKEFESMVKNTTAIERKSRGKIELPLEEVVAGNIIHLAAGDMIPADVRIISSKDLFLSQSSLTGENEPIEKFVDDDHIAIDEKTLFDIKNLAFMGSTVESGTAKCIVIAVGNETNFGSMAENVFVKKEKTSFDK